MFGLSPLTCLDYLTKQASLSQVMDTSFGGEGHRIMVLYRVIPLRDFRPLRYSSRDGHAEGEHVNRGRDTPNFCPASAIPGSRDLLTSVGS